MLAGHFGFAAMVKSRETSSPLRALMLATVWLDVVFTPLFLAHWETIQPVHEGYGGLIIHADYTHSIVAMLALSAALGAMFLPRMCRRVALVVAPTCLCSPETSATFPTSASDFESSASVGIRGARSHCRGRDHVLARSTGRVRESGQKWNISLAFRIHDRGIRTTRVVPGLHELEPGGACCSSNNHSVS